MTGHNPSSVDLPAQARHLRYLAREVRAAGDMGLVLIKDDGVTTMDVTLADQLWLVALALDGRLDG